MIVQNKIKEILMWVFLYGIYLYVSRILANIQFISNTIGDDIFSLVFPFILLYLTYLILKNSKKTLNKSIDKTLLSNSKLFKNLMLIIILVTLGFSIILATIFFIMMKVGS